MAEDRAAPGPAQPGKTRRRQFLLGLAGTAAFWASPELVEWHRSFAAEAARPYGPRYFTPAEMTFLNAACECILPRDEAGPGAGDLGVTEFIDRQMDTPYGRGDLWYMSGPFDEGPENLGYQLPLSPRSLYRKGIAGAERYCQAQYGQAFAMLDHETQVKVLTAFETGHFRLAEDVPAGEFFEQLRTNTMEGAFSDPIYGGNRHLGGWVMLGFPGARADFMDWVDYYGPPYPLGPVSISGETA